MAQTTYPFVDWTDLPQPDGSGRSRIVEDVRVGDDVWHNRDPLTQAPIFATCFHPTRLCIAGSKAAGVVAENHDGEYVFYALLEGVAVGETVRIRVSLVGHYTARSKTVFRREGYDTNFAWSSAHVQRIIFPRGLAIASVTPPDGVVGEWRGHPAVIWRRSREFCGEICVRFRQ